MSQNLIYQKIGNLTKLEIKELSVLSYHLVGCCAKMQGNNNAADRRNIDVQVRHNGGLYGETPLDMY